MQCWNCSTDIAPSPDGKLEFRATCEKCLAWLHCCKNCKNYQEGFPNNCKIPDTEFVADREGRNFCEEFELLGTGRSQQKNDAPKSLFGDGDVSLPKSFDDLFKE